MYIIVCMWSRCETTNNYYRIMEVVTIDTDQ